MRYIWSSLVGMNLSNLLRLNKTMKCPYCGKPVVKIDSRLIYGRDYGEMFACSDYPKCDSYGGTTVASKELRELRKECHRQFDKIWLSGEKKRSTAYWWMSRKMKKPKEQCHISLFREDDCRKLLKILEERAISNY